MGINRARIIINRTLPKLYSEANLNEFQQKKVAQFLNEAYSIIKPEVISITKYNKTKISRDKLYDELKNENLRNRKIKLSFDILRKSLG